jgi:hypothetical protein
MPQFIFHPLTLHHTTRQLGSILYSEILPELKSNYYETAKCMVALVEVNWLPERMAKVMIEFLSSVDASLKLVAVGHSHQMLDPRAETNLKGFRKVSHY